MTMPKLPEPAPYTPIYQPLFTESQLLAYGRQCVEAAADTCERLQIAADSPDKSAWECGTLDCELAIRAILKGETS